jgi:two-component system response regulator HydG
LRGARILIVDDEAVQRELLQGFLEKEGYDVSSAESGERAVELASTSGFEAALVDLRMSGMDGVATLKSLREKNPELAVIVMTAYASVETAVSAMKEGAQEYLTKPIDLEQLRIVLARALEKQRLVAENVYLKEELESRCGFDRVIAESNAMKEVLSTVARVAKSKATVLLTGESGTGKEVIARAIHYASDRSGDRFVPVACAALPETLLEAELFGAERGAYTGLDRLRRGRFELADGGTLFLDEIGDISAAIQAKLLRVLQDHEITRLGSDKAINVDVRVVAATNRPLKEKIKQAEFREDLYYRLNVVSIEIPPLRERREDIMPLAEHFLEHFGSECGKRMRGFTRAAKDSLLMYDWPGNVRELENAIERAVVLARGDTIDSGDLPLPVADAPKAPDLSLDAMEKEHLERILGKAGWNIGKAAEILKIHRNTLTAKLKKYGIDKP